MSDLSTSIKLLLFLFAHKVFLRPSSVCLHVYSGKFIGATLGPIPHKYCRRLRCHTSTQLNKISQKYKKCKTYPKSQSQDHFPPIKFKSIKKVDLGLLGLDPVEGFCKFFKTGLSRTSTLKFLMWIIF